MPSAAWHWAIVGGCAKWPPTRMWYGAAEAAPAAIAYATSAPTSTPTTRIRTETSRGFSDGFGEPSYVEWTPDSAWIALLLTRGFNHCAGRTTSPNRSAGGPAVAGY